MEKHVPPFFYIIQYIIHCDLLSVAQNYCNIFSFLVVFLRFAKMQMWKSEPKNECARYIVENICCFRAFALNVKKMSVFVCSTKTLFLYDNWKARSLFLLCTRRNSLFFDLNNCLLCVIRKIHNNKCEIWLTFSFIRKWLYLSGPFAYSNSANRHTQNEAIKLK